MSLNSSRRMLRTWRTPSSPYNTVGLRRNKFENGTNHPAMHRLLLGLYIRYSDVTESMLTTAYDRHFVGITRHSKGRMCRYNWHSAGFLTWPFPMLKYKYIFQIKYPEAILSNSTRRLLWFEITEMLIAV